MRRIEKPLHYINKEYFDLSIYTDNPIAILETSKFVDEDANHALTPVNEHILIMKNNKRITSQ